MFKKITVVEKPADENNTMLFSNALLSYVILT